MQDTTQHASAPQPTGIDALKQWLFNPVDLASLALYRIAFGLIMVWEVHRYFKYGWIERYWISPQFHFTYYGFSWVKPLPADGMYWLFIGLGFLSVMIAIGLWYRISIILFFLAFTYMFLLDQARYLNHFYLISLLSFLMIFLPLNRCWALDAKLWPETAQSQAPAWTLWLMRFQIGVPYFFGGIAKLNPDWLRAEPMRRWLSYMTDFPLLGRWFTEEWMVYAMSYGGLLFDLFIVPALLWRKTRALAFTAAVCFHIMNDNMFMIGIFPWFMICASTLFFVPDWPRRLIALVWKKSAADPAASTAPPRTTPRHQQIILALLICWISFQCLVPLRHVLYPGNPSWTEEGHRFAWHMKLRGKSGSARFYVYDNDSDKRWTINSRAWLPTTQERKMVAHPDMILQFAHYIAERKALEGYPNVSVYADVRLSLNGRNRQPFIDTTVDLSQEKRTLRPVPWVLPLTEPLHPPKQPDQTPTNQAQPQNDHPDQQQPDQQYPDQQYPDNDHPDPDQATQDQPLEDRTNEEIE